MTSAVLYLYRYWQYAEHGTCRGGYSPWFAGRVEESARDIHGKYEERQLPKEVVLLFEELNNRATWLAARHRVADAILMQRAAQNLCSDEIAAPPNVEAVRS